MYILGIHDGHNCGAALINEGKVVTSISEERLTRKKNEVGYPRLSIEECLKPVVLEYISTFLGFLALATSKSKNIFSMSFLFSINI